MPVSAARDVDAITRITRDTDARVLALAAYDQLLTLLDQLAVDDWDRRVPDCPAWTVADTVSPRGGGPRLELEASTFCRTVSGREPGEGLLATHVLF